MTAQRAAPAATRILAHAGHELRTTLRNGEQVLLSLILPAMALVFLSTSSLISIDSPDRVQLVTPGVLTLAVMSSAFSGQAIDQQRKIHLAALSAVFFGVCLDSR